MNDSRVAVSGASATTGREKNATLKLCELHSQIAISHYQRGCALQIEYGRKVRDAAVEKYGVGVLKSDEMDIFVRMVMSRVDGLLEILDFVVKFSELGLHLNMGILSQDIMSKIVDAGARKGKSVMPLLWSLRNRLVSSQKEGTPHGPLPVCSPKKHLLP